MNALASMPISEMQLISREEILEYLEDYTHDKVWVIPIPDGNTWSMKKMLNESGILLNNAYRSNGTILPRFQELESDNRPELSLVVNLIRYDKNNYTATIKYLARIISTPVGDGREFFVPMSFYKVETDKVRHVSHPLATFAKWPAEEVKYLV